MPITRSSNKQRINDYFNGQVELMLRQVIQAIHNVGLNCVIEARNNGSYTDQTANLRSSVGYIIVLDGKIIDKDIKLSGSGSDGSTGVNSAETYAQELAQKLTKGLHLVLLAGMPYAIYVESRRNVLASAEIMAKRDFTNKIKDVLKIWDR